MPASEPIRSQPTPVQPLVPPDGAAMLYPAVLGYRSRRDDVAPRTPRLRRHPRRRRHRHRRTPICGAVALVAASLLALAAIEFVTTIVLSGPRANTGARSAVCLAYPLSFLAVICGIVGAVPGRHSTFCGRCALIVTGVSWLAFAAGCVLAVTVVASR